MGKVEESIGESFESLEELEKARRSLSKANRIFHLLPKSPGKETGPLVDGALNEGAGEPINGMRWLLPVWAMDRVPDTMNSPQIRLRCFI